MCVRIPELNYNSSFNIYFYDETLQIAMNTQSFLLNLRQNFLIIAQTQMKLHMFSDIISNPTGMRTCKVLNTTISRELLLLFQLPELGGRKPIPVLKQFTNFAVLLCLNHAENTPLSWSKICLMVRGTCFEWHSLWRPVLEIALIYY